MKPIPKALKLAREDDVFMVTCPHYWGSGKTLADAKKELRSVGGRIDGSWRVYSVSRDTTMTEMGYINHPLHQEPIMLAENNPK